MRGKLRTIFVVSARNTITSADRGVQNYKWCDEIEP